MPICEVLTALVVSALAADAPTVIRILAGVVSGALRRWGKHKREWDDVG